MQCSKGACANARIYSKSRACMVLWVWAGHFNYTAHEATRWCAARTARYITKNGVLDEPLTYAECDMSVNRVHCLGVPLKHAEGWSCPRPCWHVAAGF
eukprot:5188135-Pyramimonas_sp.AAC.3